jgi:hypothetical protein
MPGEDAKGEQQSKGELQAEGKVPGFGRVAATAKGYAALYAALMGVAVYGIYATQTLSGPIVGSIFTTGILGILFGRDVAGAAYRRLERELETKHKEIERIAKERNALQRPFLASLQSSNRKKQ